MAKEKKRSYDEKKDETTFYHETIGIASIVLSIIILGKLGKIGIWLSMFSKLLFGDFFWFFILFLMIFGLYNLLLHKSFDFKNQRFIGYIFFSLGLLVFAHFKMHSSVSKLEGNYFEISWKIYFYYIKHGGNIYLGGGLIGMIIFYIFYYLLGVIGVSLVASILLIMGISLLCDKSLVELYNLIINWFKNFGKYSHRFNRFFKYEMGFKIKKKKNDDDIFKKNKKVPLKTLTEVHNLMNLNLEEKIAYETKSLINSVLNTLNLEYKEIRQEVGYSFTVYEYLLFSNFDFELTKERLKKVIGESLICTNYNITNLRIEVINKNIQVLGLKNLLLMQENLNNNYLLPIGLNASRRVVEIDLLKDQHILLIGSYKSGIKNFIKSLIVSLFIKVSLINYDITIIDSYKDFSDIKDWCYLIETNLEEALEKTINEIDYRMDFISKNNLNNLEEVNKKIELENLDQEKFKRKFIIVNQYSDYFNNYSFYENKLMYINQLGSKCGINLIYIIRSEDYLSSVILSIFPNKLIFKTDSPSFSVLSTDHNFAYYLNGSGDIYYSYKGELERVQTSLISSSDIEKINDYLKK